MRRSLGPSSPRLWLHVRHRCDARRTHRTPAGDCRALSVACKSPRRASLWDQQPTGPGLWGRGPALPGVQAPRAWQLAEAAPRGAGRVWPPALSQCPRCHGHPPPTTFPAQFARATSQLGAQPLPASSRLAARPHSGPHAPWRWWPHSRVIGGCWRLENPGSRVDSGVERGGVLSWSRVHGGGGGSKTMVRHLPSGAAKPPPGRAAAPPSGRVRAA